jgi:hypothetical protein
MPSTNSPSLSSNKNAPIEYTNQFVKIVRRRLEEAGIDTHRFIQLQPGKKAPINHTLFPPDDVDDCYGVYAGSGLVFLDIDDYRDGTEVPDALDSLPKTLTVESAHNGKHLYYQIEEPVPNSTESWGEIRAYNQYVVGPGTELKQCTKETHDCSRTGEGRYEILLDLPIATISIEDLNACLEEPTESRSTESTVPDWMSDEEVETDFVVEDRLRKMMQSAKGEKIEALWEGRYRDAEFDDRSRAEASLVAYLGWWMQGDRMLVKELMDRACREHPTADVNGPRKWTEVGELYQTLTLDFAIHDDYYQPPSPKLPYDERPAASHITRKNYYYALLDLGIARTTEIVEHESFDRGTSAAVRARNWYEENGTVIRVNEPGSSRTYYYLDGLENLIDPEMRTRLGIE